MTAVPGDERRRDAALGFDRNAAAYERARPSYPAEAVAHVVGHGAIGPGRRVLDLAAGTGKLTRLLVPTGADVVAVEPVAGMREQLAAALPGVEVLDGTAEDMPLPDAAVDAVTVAQAFHWFDAQAALAEIRRVMPPGGHLFLIWNTRDRDHDWVRAFGDLLVDGPGAERPYDSYYDVDYAALVASVGAGGFTPVELWTHPWEQACDEDLLLARAESVSVVGALPDDDRARVLERVRHLARTHPDLAGKPAFWFPYVTRVYRCRTTPATRVTGDATVTDPRVAPRAARFGDVAHRYERARPLYPEAALAELASRCGLRAGTPVVDIGAGTGKLTRQLVALGAKVVAVEPAAGMRRQLMAAVPGVPVLDGTAEDVPLPDASVEIVAVGQAFHWFDTHRALDEIARVLRPAGWLALLWNERPESGWAAELWDLRQQLTGFARTYPGDGWADVLGADERFGPRTASRHDVEVTTTIDWELADSESRSCVHVADESQRHEVLEGLRRFLDTHTETAGRPQLTYTRPCMLHLCQRSG